MRMVDLLTPDRIEVGMQAHNKSQALERLATLLARGATGLDRAAILRVLREREELASTGVGNEVALPHGRVAGLSGVLAALAVAPVGVEFDAVDSRPVRIFLAVLAPERSAADHLRALARCSKLLREQDVRDRLLGARSVQDVWTVVSASESH